MKTTLKSAALLIAFVILSTGLFAQTKMIAHKSHSGKVGTFSVNGEGNFGVAPTFDDYVPILAERIPTKVTKISETLLVEEGHFNYGTNIYNDTLSIVDRKIFVVYYNKPYSQVWVNWSDSTKFSGFSEIELKELKSLVPIRDGIVPGQKVNVLDIKN